MFVRVLKRHNHTAARSLESVLELSLKKVPQHGFADAITLGIRESGLSEATHAAITPFDLVKYHLATQRGKLANLSIPEGGSSYDKLEYLLVERLKMNEAIHPRLSEALQIMTKPANLPASMEELHNLSDEFWWLANDRTSDFSWYTKRLAVSSVYVTSEVFMTQDKSANYRDTFTVARKALKKAEAAGYASNSTLEWLKFNSIASFNVVKSLTRL